MPVEIKQLLIKTSLLATQQNSPPKWEEPLDEEVLREQILDECRMLVREMLSEWSER